MRCVFGLFVFIGQLIVEYPPTRLSLQGIMGGWNGVYNLRCQPVDYSRDPLAMRVSFSSTGSDPNGPNLKVFFPFSV